MRIAGWIPKATNAHSKYVINIALTLQEMLHEHVHVQRIIVSIYLYAAIIHNDNNALCSHSVQTSPVTLVTNTDCSPKQPSPFSELCVHLGLQTSKQNGRYVFVPVILHSPINEHTHTHKGS